jgi:hypothetical protein
LSRAIAAAFPQFLQDHIPPKLSFHRFFDTTRYCTLLFHFLEKKMLVTNCKHLIKKFSILVDVNRKAR